MTHTEWQEALAEMGESPDALDFALDHLSAIQNDEEEVDVDGVFSALEDFDPGSYTSEVLLGILVFLRSMDEERARGQQVFSNIWTELKERSSIAEYAALDKYLNN